MSILDVLLSVLATLCGLIIDHLDLVSDVVGLLTKLLDLRATLHKGPADVEQDKRKQKTHKKPRH